MASKNVALSAVAVLVSLAAGCSGIPDVEGRMTITQGVYGQSLGGCDTPGCSTRVYAGLELTLSADAGGTTVIGTSTSDATGLYEIAAPPGHYWLLSDLVNDTEIDVPEGLVRWDFTSGPGGGTWTER